MKRLLLVLSCSGALACAAELAGVHSVYVFPMSHGFDQYLINRLTNDHVFLVVADPKRADAVFSDKVGDSLRDQLENIAPTPEPAKAAEPKKADDAKKADKDKPEDKPEGHASNMLTDTVNKLSAPQSNFGRAKGTVFLVDSKSRQVLWSVFDEPKDSSSRQLDRTASDIVNRLKKDLK
jgi:hypothetical protein